MKFKVVYSGMYEDHDCHPFGTIGEKIATAREPDDLKESNSLLIIWGGSDIHPDYYGHPMHRTTYPGGLRDKVEWGLVQRAIEKGISIMGVCRGAQMLCAAAGGWLIQNVSGHAGAGRHGVVTQDGKDFFVNSIHHQMMAGLEKVDHELVGWSSERRSEKGYGIATRDDLTGKVDNDAFWSPHEGWKEPEFVYFPKINGYAVQWHPEGMSVQSEATQYVLNYIQRKENERSSHRKFPVCNC